MDLTDKIVLAHAGLFDGNCRKTYKENSREACEVSTKKDYIGIIELDIRKSSDGRLYCYHGNLFQYHFTLRFPQSLKTLQERYGLNSLEEILDVITSDKTIFLDIKDSRITREDILNAFRGRAFKEVILGNKSRSLLRRFHDMPSVFVKILNGNMFCNFYNLERLAKEHFKYLEVVFPFQINKRVIERVRKSGMEFRCSGLLFLNKRSYWKKIQRYGIKHVSSDFI